MEIKLTEDENLYRIHLGGALHLTYYVDGPVKNEENNEQYIVLKIDYSLSVSGLPKPICIMSSAEMAKNRAKELAIQDKTELENLVAELANT